MSSPNPTDGSRLPLATVAAPPPLAYAPKAIAQPLYVGQPGPQPYVGVPAHNVPSNEGEWTTGLCDCFDDMTNCMITCFCPCVTFGQIAEIIDRGNTSCVCAGAMCCLICHFLYCSFWYTCTYRTKLRGLYSIPSNQCGDSCLHHFCGPCALCQEYRELKKRGFDPSIGWVANQERRTRQVGIMVPPSFPGGMIR